MSPLARATTATPPTPPTRAQGWSDERFAQVANVAFNIAGLVFPPNRQPSAESAMRRVMNARHIAGPDALFRAVERPGEARDALLAALTVGESYFFREAGALGVLERELLEARRTADREDEPLRIWSAGCATGEEPYTLAMLLRELGSPHKVRILGTDISRPRLDAARQGRYTQWSLRGVSPERVSRWFKQRGKHFHIDESIRDAVTFESLNLVSDDYPSSNNGTSGQDLILCRNVLIYFDLPTVAQIATQLLRALRPDGFLLLGASDPPLGDLVECRTFMTTSGAVYQRADGTPRAATQQTPWLDAPEVHEWTFADLAPVVEHTPPTILPPRVIAPEPGHTSESPQSEAAVAYSRGDYRAAAESVERAMAAGADDVPLWIVWIRALANAGELSRAGEVTAAAIDRHRMEPELHYLHGILLLEGGQVAAAARAARRALYLDRDFVIGHMLLGDALSRLGDDAGAHRAFENAMRQLEQSADASIMRAADGVSAPRMRHIAAERLRGLGMRG